MVTELYEKQLLGASKFVKVFKREARDSEAIMPSFPGRGHFQCDCEDIPGMTAHGYYNTIIFGAYNMLTEQYEPMWSMVVNRNDTWWEERSLDDDLKRYFCQAAPSFFKLPSFEEYYFTWPMVEDVRMYVRMLGSKHINDVIYLDQLLDDSQYDVENYDMKVFVWMSKMPGIYVDPNGWNPWFNRPLIDDIRAYNQSRFEEMIHSYGILEDQGDLGPILTPIKEEESIEQEEASFSEVNSAVVVDEGIVETAISSNIFTTQPQWNSADTLDPFSWNTEPGADGPTI